MIRSYRLVPFAALTLTLTLSACSTPPSAPQSADATRDTPVTGSHLTKHYTGGPDASGVSTYGGTSLTGAPTGNGIPVPSAGH